MSLKTSATVWEYIWDTTGNCVRNLYSYCSFN
jgi:hypothetical protein